MDRIAEAMGVIKSVRESADKCILFCSLGKDSLVLLDLLYPVFGPDVKPVFMYFVKGLDHVERYIRWAESKYPGVVFEQVPHWNLTYTLRSGLYCVPNPKVKLLKLQDIVHTMRLTHNTKHVFLGMKKADGMNRRLMLMGYEKEGYVHQGMCYPLADWTQKDILSYMRQRGLPEPVRYSLKASSGVGFNLDCFLWMERNSPQDLEKIYKVFPMSRRILTEYHLHESEEANNEQVKSEETEVVQEGGR